MYICTFYKTCTAQVEVGPRERCFALEVRAYFQTLDLDLLESNALLLVQRFGALSNACSMVCLFGFCMRSRQRYDATRFHILDDGDGEVTQQEFINGIIRCKGHARAIDQVALQTDVRMLDKKLANIEEALHRVAGMESKHEPLNAPWRKSEQVLSEMKTGCIKTVQHSRAAREHVVVFTNHLFNSRQTVVVQSTCPSCEHKHPSPGSKPPEASE